MTKSSGKERKSFCFLKRFLPPKNLYNINADHNPVIVFGKYEIANGAAGEITFEITAQL